MGERAYLRSVLSRNRKQVLFFVCIGWLCQLLGVLHVHVLQRVLGGFETGTLQGAMLSLYVALLSAEIIANYIEEAPRTRLSKRIQMDFTLLALSKMRTIQYTAHQMQDTGALMQRIENGAAAGRGMLFDFVLCIASEQVPSVLLGIVFIWGIDPRVMPAIAIGYVLVLLISGTLLRVLYRIKARILDGEEYLGKQMLQGLTELVIFRTNRRYASQLRRARKESENIVDSSVRMRMVHELFFMLFALLVTVVKGIVLLMAWRGGTLSVGAVVALLSLIDRVYAPIAIFNVLYVQYKLDRLAYARLVSFLDLPDDARLLGGGMIPGDACPDIVLEDVSVSLGGHAILSGLSHHMPAGAMTAIIGESGSGKSTVGKLVAGLLMPDAGRVLVGGQDMAQMDLDAYYQDVLYFSQDAPVFAGTLRENIALEGNAADAVALDALERMQLGGFLRGLPDGLDTQLGERGTLVSGGERQRIALCRLLCSDARLIILDEATSALDMDTERLVMQAVRERVRGRTTLVIAHRESAYEGAAHVIRLEALKAIEA